MESHLSLAAQGQQETLLKPPDTISGCPSVQPDECLFVQLSVHRAAATRALCLEWALLELSVLHSSVPSWVIASTSQTHPTKPQQ